jgi:hypothetical protein
VQQLVKEVLAMGFDGVQALLQNPKQLLGLGRIVTVFVQLTRDLGLLVDPRLRFRDMPIGSR